MARTVAPRSKALAANPVDVNVLIVGEDTTLVLKAPKDASVADLKEAIKREQQYALDAHDIFLFQEPTEEFVEALKQREIPKISCHNILAPSRQLRELDIDFETCTSRIHVLAITHKLKLNVLVVGDLATFSVDVLWLDRIHYIKNMIKDKIGYPGPASTIQLYHGGSAAELEPLKQLPVDERVRDQFLTNDNKLEPIESASHYFELFPTDSMIHILAVVPSQLPSRPAEPPIEAPEMAASASASSTSAAVLDSKRQRTSQVEGFQSQVSLLARTLSWSAGYFHWGVFSLEDDGKREGVIELLIPVVSTIVGLLPDTAVAWNQRCTSAKYEFDETFGIALSRNTKRVCLMVKLAKSIDEDEIEAGNVACDAVADADPTCSAVLIAVTNFRRWLWFGVERVLEHDRAVQSIDIDGTESQIWADERGVRADQLADVVGKLHAALK